MFTFSSDECGSGKTRSIINFFNNNPSIKGVIVQNTMKLMEQTNTLLNDSKVINTETSSTVYDDIINYLINPTNQVLIISDKMFWKVGPSIKSDVYQIFLDDITSHVDFTGIEESNKSMKTIVQNDIFMNIQQITNTNFSTSSINDTSGGELFSALTAKFDIMKNNDHCIFNTSWLFDDKVERLGIAAYKDLSKYAHLNIHFSANSFNKSIIYLANKHLFTEKPLDGISTRTTPIADRLEVYYFSDENLSKSWKMRNPDELAKVYSYLNNNLKPDSYYWTKNKSDSHKVNGVEKFNLGTDPISCDTRGINSLQSFNTCVWLAALRPSDTEIKQYELMFNISGAELLEAREHETLWQFVLRGCVRNFNSDEVQKVFVFSKEQAESLGTANIHKIDIGIGVIRGKAGRPTNEVQLDVNLKVRLSRALSKNMNLSDFMKFVNKNAGTDEAIREVLINRYENYKPKK
ncbi:hypothetical protein [Aeromonas hydrophila]|uniref:hypothetical protein n=1 Tax=Aeromonas hydrophila TaxID=644 RepID=UPI000F51B90A|nr:hypothetical protein [Aeromonas hydrophila]RQM69747.1 hypothetical protein EHZ82_10175 [Aeromonas hydrophila]